MSSHILQEIQATVDRIIIIDQGKIVADGTSEELIAGSKGNSKLNIEIYNADENDIENMKAVIPAITIKGLNKTDDRIQLSLEYKNNSDPRKDVFNYAVEKGWIITEMIVSKRNLEDLFRNLTLKKDAVNE